MPSEVGQGREGGVEGRSLKLSWVAQPAEEQLAFQGETAWGTSDLCHVLRGQPELSPPALQSQNLRALRI